MSKGAGSRRRAARRAQATCLAGLVTAFALLGWGPGAGSAAGAIKVRTEEGSILAKYKSVDCQRNRRGFFADHGKVQGWKFRAVIYDGSFDGFHTYKIRYGDRSDADFSVFRPNRSYSNVFIPKTDIPRFGVGGSIQFPKGRKVLRIGFAIAYDRQGPDPQWVSVVGQARCRY